MRHECKPNTKYVIIPATKCRGDLGKYFLSIYSELDMHQINIKRINGPDAHLEEYKFIPEEYHKAHAKDVPAWKKQAILDSVPHLVDAGNLKKQERLT